MYKLAEQVKEAEVRGCMAAFVDAGMVKVAGQAAFDELCSEVAKNVGDNYDLEKVAAVTEAVLTGAAQGQTKVAAETARNAALGELLLLKTAGQIDDATFRQSAAELIKMGAQLALPESTSKARSPLGVKAQFRGEDFLNGVKGAFRGDDLRRAWSMRDELHGLRGNRESVLGPLRSQVRKGLAKGALKSGLAYGGAASALAGTAYLGKKLYDKYANPEPTEA